VIAACKHCGREIRRLPLDYANAFAAAVGVEPFESFPWLHTTGGGGYPRRTCRAASYDPLRVDALGKLPFDPRWDSKHSPSAEPVEE